MITIQSNRLRNWLHNRLRIYLWTELDLMDYIEEGKRQCFPLATGMSGNMQKHFHCRKEIIG